MGDYDTVRVSPSTLIFAFAGLFVVMIGCAFVAPAASLALLRLLVFREKPIERIRKRLALDVAERRQPQDGRITMKINGRSIDLRVATLPTVYGEKMVMRIFDRGFDTIVFTGPTFGAVGGGVHVHGARGARAMTMPVTAREKPAPA